MRAIAGWGSGNGVALIASPRRWSTIVNIDSRIGIEINEVVGMINEFEEGLGLAVLGTSPRYNRIAEVQLIELCCPLESPVC